MTLSVGCSQPEKRSGAEDEKLRALPYVSWGRIEERDASKHGVTIHDPERAYPGLNLYNSLPRPSATLIDMDGRTLHTWSADTGSEWGHVEILAGGDLLVLSEAPYRLIRLTGTRPFSGSGQCGRTTTPTSPPMATCTSSRRTEKRPRIARCPSRSRAMT